MNRDALEAGRIYTGVVDRISSSGNAIIECEDSHVNLGELSKEAVGEEVGFIFLGINGKCLDEEYTTDDYSPSRLEEESKRMERESKSQDPTNKNKLINGHL